MCNWASNYVGGAKGTSFHFFVSRCQVQIILRELWTGNRICTRVSRMMSNFDSAFRRDQCAFFSPAIKNGGPDPALVAGQRKPRNQNAKRELVERRVRSRRSALDECDGSEQGAMRAFCELDNDNAEFTLLTKVIMRERLNINRTTWHKRWQIIYTRHRDIRDKTWPFPYNFLFMSPSCKWCVQRINERVDS